MTDAALRDALRNCYVPGARTDIVTAGWLRATDVLWDEEAPGAGIPGVPRRFIARIVLEARAADPEANELVRLQIANRLAGLAWISRSEITLAAPLFPILV